MVSSGLRPVRSLEYLRLVDSGPVRPRARNSSGAARKVAGRREISVRIARRRHENALLAGAACVVAVYLSMSAALHAGPFASTPPAARTLAVQVAPGDTLDSLSRLYEPEADLDQRLAQIRELNPRLDLSEPLQPGTRLALPLNPVPKN